MSFGTKNSGGNDGYHYAPDYQPNERRATGPLVKLVGTGVLLAFGFVGWSLLGKPNPLASKTQSVAQTVQAEALEPSDANTLIDTKTYTELQKFGDTMTVLRSCADVEMKKPRQSGNHASLRQWTTVTNDYYKNNFDTYLKINQTMMLAASERMKSGDLSALGAVRQDMAVLDMASLRRQVEDQRKRGVTDPVLEAQFARYETLETKAKNPSFCLSTLSKVRTGKMNIEI